MAGREAQRQARAPLIQGLRHGSRPRQPRPQAVPPRARSLMQKTGKNSSKAKPEKTTAP
ncbi:Uncharacterised protein [Bordetella pertussis]|nr:Uncharacterised protein [Bordetella pertussis]